MFCTLQGYVWSPFMPRSKEINCATLRYAPLINDIKNQHKLGSLINDQPSEQEVLNEGPEGIEGQRLQFLR